MFNRRKRGDNPENSPDRLANEALAALYRGDYWVIKEDELQEPVPDNLRESPGLLRGEESLRAIRDYLSDIYRDGPDDDQGPSGGGGPPKPTPNRPHDPVGGGSATPEPIIDLV